MSRRRRVSLRSRSGSPGAFTLIELLVVIAVIMILAALTLPVLNRAVRQGRAVSCVNNVRQLAAAFRTYTTNFKGHMTGIQGGCKPDNQPTWLYPKDPDHTDNTTIFPDVPTKGQLFPYYRDPHLVLCPADQDGNGKFSYSVPQQTAFKIVDQVENPVTATLVIEEHPKYNIAGRTEDGNTLARREGGFGCSDRPAGRHSKKTGQSYFDGHAALVQYDEGYSARDFEIRPWGVACGWW